MKYHLSREILINAPVEKVFSKVVDLKQWPHWSPWAKMDPDTVNNYSKTTDQVGSFQEWNGQITGQGKQEITAIEKNKSINFSTVFLAPFKAVSEPIFEFESKKDATLVRWHMNGNIPFFLFFIKKMMEFFIGRDYERGLSMLKEYVETGEVLSTTKYEGLVTLEGRNYIGIRTKTSLADLPANMRHDFDALMSYVSKHKLKVTGVPFALYHQFDIMKDKIDYSAGIALESEHQAEAPFYLGKYPTIKAIKVLHTGSYSNLATSWTAASSWFRTKKLKSSKPALAFEFYVNNPATTPAKKLQTEIFIGAR